METILAIAKPAEPSGPVATIKRLLKRINLIFALTVLVPTGIAIIYYGLIASDIYISESRFVVRSPQRQSQTGLLSSLLSGTGFSRSQDDAYSVHDFIKSRDALKALDDQLGLRKKFSAGEVDFLNRFGALDRDTSFEALQKYYQKRVGVDADSTSGISVLQVNAFSADDAKKMNELLLAMSEKLVNQLSDRGREDILRTSLAEAAEAEKKAKAAAFALAAFRNQNGVVDPERQTTIQLQQMSKLQDELIATRPNSTRSRHLPRTIRKFRRYVIAWKRCKARWMQSFRRWPAVVVDRSPTRRPTMSAWHLIALTRTNSSPAH